MNFPYINFHGSSEESNEIELRNLLKNVYNIELKKKRKDVEISSNLYIYCYIDKNIIYINTIDIFCSEKYIIDYAFQYLNSQKIYNQENVFLIFLNIDKSKQLSSLLKIYIEKYPDIFVFLTSKTIHPSLEYISFFYNIRVPCSINSNIELTIEFDILNIKSQIQELILNYFDTRYILKLLVHKAEQKKNIDYKTLYHKAVTLDNLLIKSSQLDHPIILENFVISTLV